MLKVLPNEVIFDFQAYQEQVEPGLYRKSKSA